MNPASTFIAGLLLCSPLYADGDIRFLGATAPPPNALAIEVLGDIQPRSIRENIELCGYILEDQEGRLHSSAVTTGTLDSCLPPEPAAGMIPIASYHTHAAYDPDYDSEVPSESDVLGDLDEGIDGYVATPGGRVWLIDTDTEQVIQLCQGCVPTDPAFVSGDIPPRRMSFEELVLWLTY